MHIACSHSQSPPELGTEPLIAQLPAGMQCAGGPTGDKCLVVRSKSYSSASKHGTKHMVPCSNSRTLLDLGLAWSCNKEVLLLLPLPLPPPQLLLLLEVDVIYCKD